MKKKIVILLLTLALALSGCGSSAAATTDTAPSDETAQTAESTEGDISELDSLGDIEVEENLFSVELTIPAEYIGESTQEDLDAIANENGYKSVTLNSDGSATYVMTKAQHEEMMNELAANINDSLAQMIGSEDYPNITEVVANDNFTEFTVTTTSTELSLNESFSVLAFYMYGGMYNIFNGTPVDNVHVDFINADSGENIGSSDSSESENAE